MTTAKKQSDPYDYTRSTRSRRLLEELIKSGGRRIAADLDAKAVKGLESLLAAGYADTKIGVLRRALADAMEKHLPAQPASDPGPQ